MYILLHAQNDSASIFISTEDHGDHDHDDKGEVNEMRDKVREIYNSGTTKPKHILQELRRLKLKEPDSNQMSYWLRCIRLEKFGPARIDLNFMKDWCIKKSIVPEELELDKPFVAKFEIGLDEHNKPYFRFFVTIRRLIMLLKLC